MGQDQSQVFLALSCGVQTPQRVIICRGFRALGVTEWAGGAEGALKWKARQSHSWLMLSESERSCDVFWQLTRLVWILQHKARTVVCVYVHVYVFVSAHLLGNVPLGYFLHWPYYPAQWRACHITCSLWLFNTQTYLDADGKPLSYLWNIMTAFTLIQSVQVIYQSNVILTSPLYSSSGRLNYPAKNKHCHHHIWCEKDHSLYNTIW